MKSFTCFYPKHRGIRKGWLFVILPLFLMLYVLGAKPQPAFAATITVNSVLNTSPSGDGNCTLREAITNANGDTDSTGGDCVTGSGADTITFSVNGTITLSSTLPNITSEIIINGTGHTIAISGNNAVRVFYIGSGGNLTLNALTVQNGNAGMYYGDRGGGVYNDLGTLTVTDCTFSNNFADEGGAIHSDYQSILTTVTNTTFTGNSASSGGAIDIFSSTVNVTGSTFTDNSASNGGAFYNWGTLTVDSSTVSNNTASTNGGGIYNYGTLTVNSSSFSGNTAGSNGGAIDNYSSAATINNSTVSDNTAIRGGGLYANYGSATVFNSTISGNTATSYGGGIYFDGSTVWITGSTLSDNSAPNGGAIARGTSISGGVNMLGTILDTGADGVNCDGWGYADKGFNISDDDSCGFWLPNGSRNNAALNLDPLAFNDGGSTQTHMPGYGSSAIAVIPYGTIVNNGTSVLACNDSSTDQNGISRPRITNRACTAGAVEVVDSVVSCPNPANIATEADFDACLTWANNYPNVDILTLGADITLSTELPYIISEIIINGAGHVVDGNHSLRAFNVRPTGNLTLNTLTIQNGDVSAFVNGGGIYNAGILAVNHNTISNNSAGYGGGIYSDGTLTVTDSTISSNTAFTDDGYSYGGGIYSTGSLTVTNSTIFDNLVNGEVDWRDGYSYGGGIYSEGSLTVTNSTISGNSATQSGGGVGEGGGIFNSDTLTVTNSTITNNSASNGGGIFNWGTMTLADSTISDNVSIPTDFGDGEGGGIYNLGQLTMTNSTVFGNTAFDGGGVYTSDTMTVIRSTIFNNSASSGGGIYNAATLTVTNSTISGNSASNQGGGFHHGGTLTITQSTLFGNSSPNGGGFYIDGTYGSVLDLAGILLDTGASGVNCFIYNGGIVNDNGYNLSDDTSCSFSSLGSQDDATLNLDPLAYNDGGSTQTHLPGAGSDAIGAIPNGTTVNNNGVILACNGSTTDQNGISRPRTAGGACASGSVEREVVVPSLSINDVTQAEGNSGTTTFTFTVTRTAPTNVTSTVQYATANGTATAGSDYTAKSGTLTFGNGVTTQTIAITAQGDTAFEPDETFFVNLSNPTSATISDNQGLGTIQNDDVAPPPAAPSSLTATAASQTQINLGWTDNSSDETNFRIERSPNGSTGWAEIDTAAANATSYQNTGLTCGTTYYYRVRAYRGGDGQFSAYSNTASTATQACPPFLAPSDLNATGVAEDQINLSWTDNSSDETNFRIERSPNGSTGWAEIDTAAANATSYENTGLACNTTYYYRVRAYRGGDGLFSAYSNTASATTQACSTVPGLIAPPDGTLTNNNRPTFTWNPTLTGDSYQIQIATTSDFLSPVQDVTQAGLSYTATTLADATTYYWHVRAYSGGVPGPWSATWSVSIDSARLSVPLLRSPRDGINTPDQTPKLSWKKVKGAVAYHLQLSSLPDFDGAGLEVNLDTLTATSYTLPDTHALVYGTYYWRARARDAAGQWSDWSVVRSFTVTLLKSPKNGDFTTDTTPAFTWSKVTGASQYQFQLATDAGLTNLVVDQPVTGTRFIPVAPLVHGRYYWRVSAQVGGVWSEWTPTWAVIVTPTPPGKPVLVAPANKTPLTDETPDFAWAAVPDAATYQIQIDDQRNFISPVQDAIVTDTGYSADPLADSGTYYWRVRALNSVGTAGKWSSRWSFNLVGPGVPVLLGPANNTRLAHSTPDLTWGGVSGFTEYQVQVSQGKTFGLLTDSAVVSGLSHTTSPLADGLYYWRVRTINASGVGGPWTAPWRFTVDTTGPAAPVLKAPRADSGTSDTTPTFTWKKPKDGVQYQFQVASDAAFTTLPINTPVTATRYTPAAPLPYGRYYWRVMAQDAVGNWGDWSLPSTFTLTGLKAPKDASTTTDATPAFIWVSVPGVTVYQLQVATEETFTPPTLIDTPVTGTRYTPATPLAYGLYYWRISADGGVTWTPAWTFTITPGLPGKPKLVVPRNKTLTNDNTPTLNWLAVPDGVVYQVQIDDDPKFYSPAQDVLLAPGELSYVALALPDGTWYWHVRALNAVGAPGKWSPRWAFTVDVTPPVIPAPTGPADETRVTNPKLKLEWGKVSDAVRYEIQLDTDPAFPLPSIDVGKKTSYKPPVTLAQATYYWRVRAIDKAGNVSLWSDGRIFHLVAGNTIVTTPTPDPTEVPMAQPTSPHKPAADPATPEPPVITTLPPVRPPKPAEASERPPRRR